MSDLTMNCPHCNQALELPESMAGQDVACPACQGQFQIPPPKPVPLPKPIPVLKPLPMAKPVDPPKQASPEESTKPCPFCAETILLSALKCKHCGEFLNKGGEPSNAGRKPSQTGDNSALWNPNAAINWSLLFTPILGGLLHASNWDAMGEPEKAKESRLWAWGTIPVIVVSLFLRGDVARLIQIAYISVWYFVAAKKQAKRVKELYGTSYPRKPWGKVLGIAAAIFAGVLSFLFVLAVAALE